MSEATFETIEQWSHAEEAGTVLEKLIASLESNRDYHKLFDALLLKKRLEMGLPLIRPTSMDDVPADRQQEFEEAYVAAASKVGHLFLAQNDIAKAWVYLRTVGETQAVAKAIGEMDITGEADEDTEELLNIALYEGANPVKGLELMLRTHGTCNTVTALDQMIHQLSPEDRSRAAELLVTVLYDDLKYTLQQEVQQKLTTDSPPETIRELITDREWLFAEGNYHVDVSHLNAVVRFSRFLQIGNPILQKAIELAEYGACLAPQFQYPADPPFDDFYPAHVQFFQVLADQDREEALAFFNKKLEQEPDAEDQPMLAYVLVDLLTRLDRLDEAVEIAGEHLKNLDESSGFSFAGLCREAGRMDILAQAAREQNDLVAYTAALLEQETVSA